MLLFFSREIRALLHPFPAVPENGCRPCIEKAARSFRIYIARSDRPRVLSRILFDPFWSSRLTRSLFFSFSAGIFFLSVSVSLSYRTLSEKCHHDPCHARSLLMYASRYLTPAKAALKKVKGQQSNVECALMYERLYTCEAKKFSWEFRNGKTPNRRIRSAIISAGPQCKKHHVFCTLWGRTNVLRWIL